jgi:hypothetical protein
MSKWLISIVLAAAAMAQTAPVQQTALWQRAKTGTASRQSSAAKAADPKIASAQPSTDPEVAEAVRWERAKDQAAQRQIAKSKKK